MVFFVCAEAELARMLMTCVSTVRRVSQSRRAIPRLVRPSAMSASTGVERRAAVCDAAEGVEEVVDVEDAVLPELERSFEPAATAVYGPAVPARQGL